MNVEPWLRGPIPGIHPYLAPVEFALLQAAEDLHRYTATLDTGQVWATPLGLPSVGFHLRHIAGSLDRLLTYMADGQLTSAQLDALQNESKPGAVTTDLLDTVHRSIIHAIAAVRALDPTTLTEPRFVGRKRLPTTVIGLAIHLAEHTQRHVGQTITTCKVVHSN